MKRNLWLAGAIVASGFFGLPLPGSNFPLALSDANAQAESASDVNWAVLEDTVPIATISKTMPAVSRSM